MMFSFDLNSDRDFGRRYKITRELHAQKGLLKITLTDLFTTKSRTALDSIKGKDIALTEERLYSSLGINPKVYIEMFKELVSNKIPSYQMWLGRKLLAA